MGLNQLCTALYNIRSLRALRALTSSWRPFGPLDFVLRALWPLKPVRRARLSSCGKFFTDQPTMDKLILGVGRPFVHVIQEMDLLHTNQQNIQNKYHVASDWSYIYTYEINCQQISVYPLRCPVPRNISQKSTCIRWNTMKYLDQIIKSRNSIQMECGSAESELANRFQSCLKNNNKNYEHRKKGVWRWRVKFKNNCRKFCN